MQSVYENYFRILLDVSSFLHIKISKISLFLFSYYFLGCLAALFEGLSLLLFASIITSVNSINDLISGIDLLNSLFPYFQDNNLFFNIKILIIMFSITFVLKVFLNILEGYCVAKLRKNLQSSIFLNYLESSWEDVNDLRVGDSVGLITNEILVLVKYIHSFILILFHFLYGLILIILACKTNFEITMYIFILLIPFVLIMKFLVVKQAVLGEKLALARNMFSGDITDRLNGLFQIHVSNFGQFHFLRGVRKQYLYTMNEIKIALYQSIIQNFSILLPLVGLIILFSWLSIFFDSDEKDFPMTAIAGIGLLGLKITGQFNSLSVSLSNLVRLIGGVKIVNKAFKFSEKPNKKQIISNIKKINVNNVEYSYYKKKIFKNLSFELYPHKINLIKGKSGSGKTTLIKLIIGLLNPTKGEILYDTKNNILKSSLDSKINFGYVTQDIYLFNETVRDNLLSGMNISDSKIWRVLRSIDAVDFVKEMGGLDKKIDESGKNLSGGQIKRLGIARVLLSKPKVIIFDEPTSGLDKQNKNSLLKLIKKLSNDFMVIIISHEELIFSESKINLVKI